MADLFSKGGSPIFGGKNTGGWTVNAAGGAYIDDWVTIGVNGGIFQGTGTPASPTTALKIYNSSGIGLVEMWKAGVKTFYFDTNGDVTLSGTITATAGSIGGWTIGSGLLSAGSGSDAVGLAPGSYPFYAGNTTAASAPFRVSKAGALTATAATLTGSISAASGAVTIGANGIDITAGTASGNRISWYESTNERMYIQADPTGEIYALTLHSADPGSGVYPSAAYVKLSATRNSSNGYFQVSYNAQTGVVAGVIRSSLTADGLAVTGHITATTALIGNEGGGDNDSRIEGNGDANLFFVDASTDRVGIGTNAPASLLDVNGELRAVDCILAQGTAHDYILDLRSSDVAHGITYYADTSQYLGVMKASATNGGTFFRSFTAATNAFNFQAFYTTDITTKTTGSGAPITFTALKKNGADITTQGANANLAAFVSYSTTVWIVDKDGDTWQNGSITAVGGFGCNSKAAQTAYALDAAISGTADGTYNATEQGLINSLVSQVNKLRAALVANGICS